MNGFCVVFDYLKCHRRRTRNRSLSISGEYSRQQSPDGTDSNSCNCIDWRNVRSCLCLDRWRRSQPEPVVEYRAQRHNELRSPWLHCPEERELGAYHYYSYRKGQYYFKTRAQRRRFINAEKKENKRRRPHRPYYITFPSTSGVARGPTQEEIDIKNETGEVKDLYTTEDKIDKLAIKLVKRTPRPRKKFPLRFTTRGLGVPPPLWVRESLFAPVLPDLHPKPSQKNTPAAASTDSPPSDLQTPESSEQPTTTEQNNIVEVHNSNETQSEETSSALVPSSVPRVFLQPPTPAVRRRVVLEILDDLMTLAPLNPIDYSNRRFRASSSLDMQLLAPTGRDGVQLRRLLRHASVIDSTVQPEPSVPEPHVPNSRVSPSLPTQLLAPAGRSGVQLRRQLRYSTVIVSAEHCRNDEYRDRKIVLEFTHLLEKSKQLFTGLRALPQHGHKHWQFYFSRTFDVYTKLWKYQQQHRTLLNEEYGLRRWQIGEIASKIGQLYYHFYLRTSEVTYLFDAYEFYAAIRGRGYYAKAADESNGDLMIKRLRYYTRFIVVALLTRKLKFVEELISELDDVIMEYGDSYDPEDQIQWTMVSSEVKAFLAVECANSIEEPGCKKSFRSKTRLTSVAIPCIDKTPQMNLRLQKAVIIGSGSYQARVSELTIDMYRILQTIEREPMQPREVWEEPRNPFADGFDRAFNIEIATANAPEKNLLFKPSPTQALVYIASACEDLSPIGALLIYISADGVAPNTKGGEDYGFETGGLITTSKSDIYGEVRASTPARYKEIQCLHPGDLQPFTRKPLFLIVDSDHSTIFLKMRRPFEMPMVILMSPTEFPPSLKEYENMGGLLTLFLYCPLAALCRVCCVDNVTAEMWVEGQILINNFLQEATVVASRLPLDSSYVSFLGDDFLRVQITRYILCELVLRMHRGFVSRNHLPRASPSLPEQLFENIALTEMVLDMAAFLKVRSQFFNPHAPGGGTTN